jgi:hypothetical protein
LNLDPGSPQDVVVVVVVAAVPVSPGDQLPVSPGTGRESPCGDVASAVRAFWQCSIPAVTANITRILIACDMAFSLSPSS